MSFPLRGAVQSVGGMVASSQVLASSVGRQVLRDGGNAADACVAMDAVLHVVEPPSTSLGGDMFALFYEAKSGRISALNGSGRAPRALTLDLLSSQGLSQLPELHPHTVTVPGVCAGWFDLAERYGSIPMRRLLAPAIEFAEEGFAVGEVTAAVWRRRLMYLRGAELSIDGRAPNHGEVFRNPGLGAVLRALGEDGSRAFYTGDIAGAIVKTVQNAGGTLDLDDLASHRSTWEDPISSMYRDIRVWQCPPNGQGLAALIALNILSNFEAGSPLSAERWHRQIEALRLAFTDTRWYVADQEQFPVPVEPLLSSDYAKQRARLIQHDRATMDVQRGTPVAGSGTVYHCAVDAQGNSCSFISSNYVAFGTGLVPSGLGFTLQNRGHNFSLDPEHPNALAPGKRPYHTIIPGMLTRQDGTLLAPFGVMGGFMQPQGHVQLVMSLIDDGANPQEALDRPRFCLEPAEAGGKVMLERGMPEDIVEGLKNMGHEVVPNIPSFGRSLFGRGQAIVCQPDGTLHGGSDVRGDGCAAGVEPPSRRS